MIAAKAAGTRPAPVPEAPSASAEVVDLMAMLEKSVQDAKATRSGEPATIHQLRSKKKTAAKKISSTAPSAKKSAAKKTPPKGKPRRSA
ncbi:hypothetical protein [Streptomyces sp. NRRL S-378]|uniref:hypothetical protein n=1 Tax=Streptomyces sp. NRRL S-378 TaxID=1463904 RepID=UPI00068C37B7|nr:hypothetical protein [Streptomyces sp. NRRL S-378]